MTLVLQKPKYACRGEKNHYSIKSPKHNVEFCQKCDAYVEVLDMVENEIVLKDRCRCCGSETSKIVKKTWLARVLKAGIRQHRHFISSWVMYPEGCFVEKPAKNKYVVMNEKKILIKEIFTKKPYSSQYLEIKYRDVVYEIQVKYLALYLEQTASEDEKLDYIQKKLSIKGLRIWYPQDEEMDEKCVSCNTLLRYDLNGQIFCVQCNGRH